MEPPKGIANKPEGPATWVYIYPVRIHSQDEDGVCRFGVVTYFQPSPDSSGEWVAITVRQIFLKDWKPNDSQSVANSSERVVGKDVYLHEWTEPKRSADISSDPTIFLRKGRLGKVVRELNKTIVMIKVDDAYTHDEGFKTKGTWARMM
jgi:hypothetical protein